MTEPNWVPASCTLPTEERPLRVAEWDRLFAGHLTTVIRPDPLRLHLVLAGDRAVEEQLRDLAGRERGCCSFFTFAVDPAAYGRIHLEIAVDPAHEEVLTALHERITADRGGRGPVVSGEGLRSGQVAEAAGVNVQTLRYYERRGLLPAPDRSPGGHRRYDGTAVTVLRVVKAAQRLGFTLQEVAELLETGRHRHGRPVTGLQDHARAKLAEVDARIADLTTVREALTAALDAGCDDLTKCAGSPRCPVPFTGLAHEKSLADLCR
ncbi:MerR family transcriptional regulator [Kitasatospora sp. NPDC051853]|uniref:MerR family transcriptional regulator n=1 Tax=Kitasatospora sp. NPDC051853 TaxID=3364058 RepID=UPI003795146A